MGTGALLSVRDSARDGCSLREAQLSAWNTKGAAGIEIGASGTASSTRQAAAFPNDNVKQIEELQANLMI